ncbi:MAG: YraN family protein [Parcubacteria group bacterium]|nr:YraN family protein [Parcubacteria group bacterium]
MNNKQTGQIGEDIAVRFLKKERKYKIIARNWKNKWGEIDIVAKKKRVLMFVEVKTLRNDALVTMNFQPEQKVDVKKRKQLIKMAQLYLLQNKLGLDTPHQIDIVSVILAGDEKQIKHFENAIEDIY